MQILIAFLNAIQQDNINKEYKKKIDTNDFCIYEYEKTIDMFLKRDYNLTNITKELKNYNFEKAYLFLEKRQKLIESGKLYEKLESLKNEKIVKITFFLI